MNVITATSRLGQKVTPAEIRTWARAHGIKVGERGRLHPDVLAAYSKANPGAGGNVVVTPTPAPKPAPKPANTQPEASSSPSAIRRWAGRNGFKVGVRGRIPAPVLAAYAARKDNPAPVKVVEAVPDTKARNPYVCNFCAAHDNHERCPRVLSNGQFCYCQPCKAADAQRQVSA